MTQKIRWKVELNQRVELTGATMISRLLLLALGILLLTNCVSVNIAPKKAKKSEGVQYIAPQGSFRELDADDVDHAWQSEKTGNTIAYLSECALNSDISLQNLESESLNALTNLKIVTSNIQTYNHRESRETTAEGQVDGVDVKLKLVVFKKNDCNYTLSFVGRKNRFDQDLPIFKQFKESFLAP